MHRCAIAGACAEVYGAAWELSGTTLELKTFLRRGDRGPTRWGLGRRNYAPSSIYCPRV